MANKKDKVKRTPKKATRVTATPQVTSSADSEEVVVDQELSTIDPMMIASAAQEQNPQERLGVLANSQGNTKRWLWQNQIRDTIPNTNRCSSRG